MVPAAVVNSDEGDVGFDQSASEQAALAERVATVAIADFVGLAVNIECGLSGR